jgi:hypothetical protein
MYARSHFSYIPRLWPTASRYSLPFLMYFDMNTGSRSVAAWIVAMENDPGASVGVLLMSSLAFLSLGAAANICNFCEKWCARMESRAGELVLEASDARRLHLVEMIRGAGRCDMLVLTATVCQTSKSRRHYEKVHAIGRWKSPCRNSPASGKVCLTVGLRFEGRTPAPYNVAAGFPVTIARIFC